MNEQQDPKPELHHVSADMHDPPDEWHRHTADEERPQEVHLAEVNPWLIVGVGIGSFLLIFFTCVVVYGYYTWYVTRTLNIQEADRRIGMEARLLRDDSFRRLEAGFRDEEAGIEQAPFERAKRAVIEAYRSQGQ